MNYLIARVSDPEQKKALPAQKKKLFDYADKMKWVEGQDFEYIEFDETAFKVNRKKFREEVIQKLASEKDLAICVFDKVDRFTRDSTSDERTALTKLYKAGFIEIHFPSDNLFIHKDSPAPDLFRLEIGISLAGYYSAAIRDNVKRRFDQMLNDGIWVGRAPIGYVNYQIYDDNGKVLEKGIRLDTERWEMIREGFELRASGLPYKSIAKQMKKRGLRSREKSTVISSSQWEKILTNKFYIGTMTFKNVEYTHHYPTFIEKWLWDKCEVVRNRRANGRTKYNSKPFLFKNLKCKECGYSISFDGPKPNGTTYGKCTEYGGKHNAITIKEQILIDQVKEVLKAIQIPKQLLPDLITEIERNHASEQEHYLKKKSILQKEYDQLDKKTLEMFEDRKMFKSRPEMFEKMIKKIEKRQAEIMDELEDNSKGDKAFVIGASYILDVCSRAVELFEADSSELQQKRYLMDFVLTNMELEGQKLQLTLKEPFAAILSMAKTGNWYPGYTFFRTPFSLARSVTRES